MKLLSILLFGTFIFGIQIALAEESPKKDGWWIKVCREKVKASAINFNIGPDKDNNYSYTWDNTKPSEFDINQNYRNLEELWVKGDGERGKAKYFCAMYKEQVVRHFDFDNDEHTTMKQKDHDNECAC